MTKNILMYGTERETIKSLIPILKHEGIYRHLAENRQELFDLLGREDISVVSGRCRRLCSNRFPVKQAFNKYVKKEKTKFGLKVAVITAAVILPVVIVRLIAIGALAAFLELDGAKEEVCEGTENIFSLLKS